MVKQLGNMCDRLIWVRVAAMDALGGLLNGPRAQSPMVMRMVMATPWAIRIEDTAPLTVVAAVEGTAHIRYDDGGTARLEPGDVALFRGTHPYVIADDPGSALVDDAGSLPLRCPPPADNALPPSRLPRPLLDRVAATQRVEPVAVRVGLVFLAL